MCRACVRGTSSSALKHWKPRLRSIYDQLLTNPVRLRDFFRTAFRLSCLEGQRTLAREDAATLLSAVLPPSHPHVESMINFLRATAKEPRVTIDSWT